MWGGGWSNSFPCTFKSIEIKLHSSWWISVYVTRIKTHATDRKRCYLYNVRWMSNFFWRWIGEKCSCVVQAKKMLFLGFIFACRLDYQPLFGKWACAPPLLLGEVRPDTRERQKSSLLRLPCLSLIINACALINEYFPRGSVSIVHKVNAFLLRCDVCMYMYDLYLNTIKIKATSLWGRV